MKIIYIESEDSAIIAPELPLEDYRQPITGDYIEEYNAVIHSDQYGRIRSIEILGGASKMFDVAALESLGILERYCGKGMSREEFSEWRERLLKKRNRTKTG